MNERSVRLMGGLASGFLVFALWTMAIIALAIDVPVLGSVLFFMSLVAILSLLCFTPLFKRKDGDER